MKRFLLLLTILSLIGCAHVVSQKMRELADKPPHPAELFKDPDAQKGRFVILGGSIAGSTNTQEGTYIEVVQKPLDSRGKPEYTDVSYGRFIIFYEGYLDTAIYSKGREITVAGEVIGKKVQPLGEVQYPFPLIKSTKLHLFEPGYYGTFGIPIYIGIGVGIYSR